jgi:hypothetical protein
MRTSARVGRHNRVHVRVGRGWGSRQCSALTCGPSSAMRGQKHAVVEDSIPHTYACVVLLLAWPQRRSGSRSVAGCYGCVGGHVHADFCSVCGVFGAVRPLGSARPCSHHACPNNEVATTSPSPCYGKRGSFMLVVWCVRSAWPMHECDWREMRCIAVHFHGPRPRRGGRDEGRSRWLANPSLSPYERTSSSCIAPFALFFSAYYISLVVHHPQQQSEAHPRIRCTTCARLLTFRA